MFTIKICGVTTPEDALLAAEAGADAIGLNFYARSPRYVAPEPAAEIVRRLHERYSGERLKVVGVFVNAALEQILSTIELLQAAAGNQSPAGLVIQLHGDEPPEFLSELCRQRPDVPVVRAFRCRGADLRAEADYVQQCHALGALPHAALVDAYAPGNFGGTGQCIDWQAVAAGRQHLGGVPVILAGGLTAENVAAAIAAARPDGVDVASGVESAPGRKDAAKVAAFIAAARRALATV
jgi:phosphoribosylanthranilate isomerase